MTIAFEFEFAFFKFDSKKYNEQIIKNIQKAMQEAAKLFYKEAIKRIPIDRTGFKTFTKGRQSKGATGFTASSFGNLADLLGLQAIETKADVPAPAGLKLFKPGERRAKKRLYQIYYPFDGPQMRKTSANARKLATQSDQIFKFDKEGGMTFQYGVNISYFRIQDVQNIGRSKTAPWLAMQTGMNAFKEYFNKPATIKKLLPPFEEFITTEKITIKGD